jgi:hypothetical protein
VVTETHVLLSGIDIEQDIKNNVESESCGVGKHTYHMSYQWTYLSRPTFLIRLQKLINLLKP